MAEARPAEILDRMADEIARQHHAHAAGSVEDFIESDDRFEIRPQRAAIVTPISEEAVLRAYFIRAAPEESCMRVAGGA